jgi:hypothetical protein
MTREEGRKAGKDSLGMSNLDNYYYLIRTIILVILFIIKYIRYFNYFNII